jgi:hypothetical protein
MLPGKTMKHCNEKLFKDYEKCKELRAALKVQQERM